MGLFAESALSRCHSFVGLLTVTANGWHRRMTRSLSTSCEAIESESPEIMGGTYCIGRTHALAHSRAQSRMK